MKFKLTLSDGVQDEEFSGDLAGMDKIFIKSVLLKLIDDSKLVELATKKQL